MNTAIIIIGAVIACVLSYNYGRQIGINVGWLQGYEFTELMKQPRDKKGRFQRRAKEKETPPSSDELFD